MNPQWIWYPGDYELYHSLRLNTRREERDYQWPAFWRLDDCYHNVRFRREFFCPAPETVTVYAHGVGYAALDGKKHPFGRAIPLSPGQHTLEAAVACPGGLPCLYALGASAASGSDWLANAMDAAWIPAGTDAQYSSPEDDPERFPFAYEALEPVEVRPCQDGVLYDYGRQTFAALCLSEMEDSDSLGIFYGESEEEALDTENSYLMDTVPAGSSSYRCPPRAFRYLFLRGSTRYSLQALYEYLPLPCPGSFSCSDPRLNEIWQTAKYTFHLNSREFFLDGIKRDRWIWSGDAFQSYLINRYLFADPGLVRRTIIALRGKDPIASHINTILDYSLYWIMSVESYYMDTADLDFIRFLYPRMVSLLDYCLAQCGEDGFLRGRPEDWVFVDWADMDKTGAVCAEQMLLAESLRVMDRLEALLGAGESGYGARAAALCQAIDEKFWCPARGAYVDSFESGRQNVTRHANIFALRFGIAGEEKREQIIRSVLLNDGVPAISTPYFKFYELEALCEIGHLSEVTARMLNYWGGMLDRGATTFWEEYDPQITGIASYGMYGDRYGKSLCHAWGASPIYLLGRYYLGVTPTAPGWTSFRVAPQLGGLESLRGDVPVHGGTVHVELDSQRLLVSCDRPGGTVCFGGQTYDLPQGRPLVIEIPQH